MVDVAWKMLFSRHAPVCHRDDRCRFCSDADLRAGRAARSPAFHQLSGPIERDPRTRRPRGHPGSLSGFATSPRAKTELCRS